STSGKPRALSAPPASASSADDIEYREGNGWRRRSSANRSRSRSRLLPAHHVDDLVDLAVVNRADLLQSIEERVGRSARVHLRPQLGEGDAAYERVPGREDVDGQRVVRRGVAGGHKERVQAPAALPAALEPRLHEGLPVRRLEPPPLVELAVLDVVVIELDVAVLLGRHPDAL